MSLDPARQAALGQLQAEIQSIEGQRGRPIARALLGEMEHNVQVLTSARAPIPKEFQRPIQQVQRAWQEFQETYSAGSTGSSSMGEISISEGSPVLEQLRAAVEDITEWIMPEATAATDIEQMIADYDIAVGRKNKQAAREKFTEIEKALQSEGKQEFDRLKKEFDILTKVSQLFDVEAYVDDPTFFEDETLPMRYSLELDPLMRTFAQGETRRNGMLIALASRMPTLFRSDESRRVEKRARQQAHLRDQIHRDLSRYLKKRLDAAVIAKRLQQVDHLYEQHREEVSDDRSVEGAERNGLIAAQRSTEVALLETWQELDEHVKAYRDTLR